MSSDHDAAAFDLTARTVGAGRTIAAVAAGLVCTVLPMFLLGALSTRIRADLGLGDAAMGALIAGFFAAGAVSSIPAGHLTDRIGGTAALRAGAIIAAAASAGIALVGVDFASMLGLLIVGGTAVAMADTGGARAIAAAVPQDRHGMAFGGKEASIPAASMIAGLILPILGAQFGWRPAFALAAGFAVVVLVMVPGGLGVASRRSTPGMGSGVGPSVAGAAASGSVEPGSAGGQAKTAEPDDDRAARIVLWSLAVAAALGGGAATAAPTFLVPAAVADGLGEASAGLLLAGASILGIASRLTVGLLADRRLTGEIRLIVALMATGAVGMALLATGGTPAIIVGAILAIAGGWGWTGLAFLAAVRTVPTRPAGAAGTVLAGLATGGASGPAIFGWLADGSGYPLAWAAGAAGLLAACLLAFGADHRRRHG